jgi:hypothetical protein
MDDKELVPGEFVAEENLNYKKGISVDDAVESDDETVQTSKLLASPEEESPSEGICCRPLIFDPSSPLDDGEDVHLAAANN